MSAQPDWWLDGLTLKDWLLDGSPIRGEHMLATWAALDWSKAYVDMGPSIAGNPGPYWHVPHSDGDTVHRLYPRLLQTKWLSVVHQAILETKAAGRAEAAVPREPTEAMIQAVAHIWPRYATIKSWQAMYDAALAAK